ncbi:MAG: P-loop NTPase fold protein [Pseudomonadota bacterium]
MNLIELNLNAVREAAAAIFLIGNRYAPAPHDPTRNPRGLSVTELQYDEAVRLGRPTLVILADPKLVAKAKPDAAEMKQLDAFLKRLTDRIGIFYNAEELFRELNSALPRIAIQITRSEVAEHTRRASEIAQQTRALQAKAADIAESLKAGEVEPPAPVPAGPGLSTDEVRDLQAILNRLPGVRLPVDGVLGPQTMEAVQIHRPELDAVGGVAARLARRVAALIPLPTQEVAQNTPPNAWIFYATDRKSGGEWIDAMKPGDTIFWRHGTGGGAYRKQLRRGDTVLLLVDQEFIANGVLLADDQARFTDRDGRICRPVVIVERYQHSLSRSALEQSAGVKLVGQGAVHPVPLPALTLINDAQRQSKLDTLPRPRAAVERYLSWRRVLDELGRASSGNILPDTETATLLGWEGARRDIVEEPGPGPLPPAKKAAKKKQPVQPKIKSADPRPGPAEPPPPEPASESEPNTDFVSDDAEEERDELGRSVLAIGLARRLHRIWWRTNEPAPRAASDEDDEARASFVVHLDAPWGGGKTTFANFLGRVLNPRPAGRAAALFLRDRYPGADLGGIFLDDPPPSDAKRAELLALPEAQRRPWIVIGFNAWQVEHCAPPWWVFYQSIRKRCFDAVRSEGTRPWGSAKPAGRWTRTWQWLRLLAGEYLWRLTNPKIGILLLTAAVSLTLLVLFQALGWWGVSGAADKKTAGFLLTDGFGVLLAGLSGAGAIWGLGALFTESIMPGTDTLAERLSLGSGDPFKRFRRHFHRTMEAVERPVMVVIDDLDRCKPEFVVDLIRGIQTLLRSPRVVFLILGDRDWIERAFEAHNEKMSKIAVGPEQSFGARFVEKAIQMSFVLPSIGRELQTGYVKRILMGGRGEAAAGGVLDAGVASKLREVANRETARSDAPLDSAPIVTKAMEALEALRPEGEAGDAGAVREQVEQIVNDALAINAAVDERVEHAVAHQLQDLAGSFPANPRQIKRIVNAITIYGAVALQRPGLKVDAAFRFQLAIWIIVMTEWPETWRLLTTCPELVDCLASDDPEAAVAALGVAVLPGSVAATQREVARVLADPQLSALITGRGAVLREPLLSEHARVLAELTPLHSRPGRLAESSAPPAPPARVRTKS